MGDCKNGDNKDTSQIESSFLDKDLDAALDSFDNLFCRRCLVSYNLYSIQLFVISISLFLGLVSFWQVFDCRLHGCSQDLVFPVSTDFFSQVFMDASLLPFSLSVLIQNIVRLRSNLHGALLMMKTYHVVHIAIDQYAMFYYVVCLTFALIRNLQLTDLSSLKLCHVRC